MKLLVNLSTRVEASTKLSPADATNWAKLSGTVFTHRLSVKDIKQLEFKRKKRCCRIPCSTNQTLP